ncbi:MAG: hypothetical protein L6R19_28120 [Alphaproteobacteria bacterium]|nr:hypothetical protein [Alphaproteobacteria bacterium]
MQVSPATRLFNYLTEFPTVRPVPPRAPQGTNASDAANGPARVNGTAAAEPTAAAATPQARPTIPLAADPVPATPAAARRVLPRGTLVNIIA